MLSSYKTPLNIVSTISQTSKNRLPKTTSDYLNKSRFDENISKNSYKYLRRKKGTEILRPKTPLNPALDDRPFLGYIGRKWEEEMGGPN